MVDIRLELNGSSIWGSNHSKYGVWNENSENRTDLKILHEYYITYVNDIS